MKILVLCVVAFLVGCTSTEATYEAGGSYVHLKRTQLFGEDIDFSVGTERAQAELKKSSARLTDAQMEALGVLIGR